MAVNVANAYGGAFPITMGQQSGQRRGSRHYKSANIVCEPYPGRSLQRGWRNDGQPSDGIDNQLSSIAGFDQFQPLLDAVHHSQQHIVGEQPKPRKIYRISHRKIKRVPVTSCDSCRLRKLKCNAKELPEGTACSQCAKHGAPCTFEDREEVEQAAAAAQREKANNQKVSGRRSRSNAVRSASAVAVQAQLAADAIQKKYEQAGWVMRDTTSNSVPQPCPVQDVNLQHASQAIRLPPLVPPISRHNVVEPATQRLSQCTISQNDSRLWQDSTSIATEQATQQPTAWQMWSIPPTLTDCDTNETRYVDPMHIVTRLLERFFSRHSFNTVVIQNKMGLFARLRLWHPSPLPDFLLLTVMACSVVSDQTKEPELIAWKPTLWRLATEAVHAQLDYPQGVELDLIQALLLLSYNWQGDLARIERINTFDTAVGLAKLISLHEYKVVEGNESVQAQRVAIFWTLYCFDKIMCSTTGRLAALPRNSHNIPMPTTNLFAKLGIQLDPNEGACLQRLVDSFINLCQILEDVHSTLHRPKSMGMFATLEDVQSRMSSLEHRLETFCKDNRWFLGNLQSLPSTCRSLAEAVISQMHLTQLQLYVVAIKFEVDCATTKPMSFSANCQKALAATIESAWHLVQQTSHSIFELPQDGPASHKERPMSFSLACALLGGCFFRFLAEHWAGWNEGRGCSAYAPWRSLTESGSQFVSASDEAEPLGYNAEDIEAVLDKNETTTTQNSPAAKEDQPLTATSTEAAVASKDHRVVNGKQCRRLSLTIANAGVSTKTTEETASSNEDEQEGVEGVELTMPEESFKSRLNTSTQCDTATLMSLMLQTPARLLFQDDSTAKEILRATSQASPDRDASPVAAAQSKAYESIAKTPCLPTHAMLIPFDPNVVEAFCKLGTNGLAYGEDRGTAKATAVNALLQEPGLDEAADSTRVETDGLEPNYVHHSSTDASLTLPPLSQMTWWSTSSSATETPAKDFGFSQQQAQGQVTDNLDGHADFASLKLPAMRMAGAELSR